MAELEKAIKGLEHCDFGSYGSCYEKECPYYQSHDCTDELKNDILALLKVQEPVKPEFILTTCSGYSTADCPKCGKRINNHYHKSFCGYCGQEVKWK